MSKLGLVGLVLSMGAGCFGNSIDLSTTRSLNDPWGAPGLESPYMLGTRFTLEVSVDGPLEDYEVASLDSSIVQLNETAAGIELEAVGVGTTSVELYEDGEVLRTYVVTVTVPDELRLVTERQDHFDTTLSQLETPVGSELAVLAGEEVYLHVRYFDAGERIYGSSVLEAETEMTASIPEWAPQENVLALSAASPGTYPVTFRVGSLEETVDVHVAAEAVSLELSEPAEEVLITTTEDGNFAYGVIKADARDADGRILRGTLPIRWTVNGEALGEGTMLGITSDEGVDAEVTASLGDLSATLSTRGLAEYVAP